MTPAEKKELATEFLSEFKDPDPARLATMIANDFEWKVMTRMEGMASDEGARRAQESRRSRSRR